MKRVVLKLLCVILLIMVSINFSASEVKAQSISSDENNLENNLAEVYSSFKEDINQLEKENVLAVDDLMKEAIENNNQIIQSSFSVTERTKLLNKIVKGSYILLNKTMAENSCTADRIKYDYKQQLFEIIDNYKLYSQNLSEVVGKVIVFLSYIDDDTTGKEIQSYIILNKDRLKDIISESKDLLKVEN